MFGSPCSPCCKKCEECEHLRDVSSVELTINASDALVSYLFEFTESGSGVSAGDRFATAVYFPGSAYAGTYSLTKRSETPSLVRWQYDYTASGNVCSGEYLRVDFQLASGNTAKSYKVDVYTYANVHAYRWLTWDSPTLKTASSDWCGSLHPNSFTSYLADDLPGSGHLQLSCDSCDGSTTPTTRQTGVNVWPEQWFGPGGLNAYAQLVDSSVVGNALQSSGRVDIRFSINAPSIS